MARSRSSTPDAEPLDVDGAAGLRVGLDDDGVQSRIAGRRLELRGQGGQEPAEGRLDFDADDRIVGAGHPDIRQVGRAFRQDAFVGGLHVRVRADDGGDAAVEVPAHRDLLGRRLGVEVHEDRARSFAHLLDLALHDRERIVDVQHEHPPHDVDDADGLAAARSGRDSCRCRGRRRGSSPAGAAAARSRCSRALPSCPRCGCPTSSRPRPSRAVAGRSRG